METTNYFLELQKVKCEVEKKNWLNYISWSDWWAELKKIHPEATYRKVKNGDTYLFRSGTGWSVECEVTVWDITHCADLAVTDFKNQEIKYDMIQSTDIQNTLQRAFAKAIAMHWIGLYVYRGEDFPDEYEEETKTTQSPSWDTKTYARTEKDDLIDQMEIEDDIEHLKTIFAKLYPLWTSDKQKAFFKSKYEQAKKRIEKDYTDMIWEPEWDVIWWK